MNSVSTVYVSSVSEPSQLEIDLDGFAAWTKGITGQKEGGKEKWKREGRK